MPDDVVVGIYRATLEPEAWQRILAIVLPLFGCRAAIYVRHDRLHPRDSLYLAHGLPEDVVLALQRRDLEEDAIGRELLKHPAGTVLRATDAIAAEELARNPLHQNIAVPAGMDYALLAVLENEPQLLVDVGFTRPDCDFSDAEVALMRELVPHLRLVTELERRISLGDAGRRQALASFDRAGQPLLVLDRSGYALHCNPLARAIFDRADGVELKFGRLVFDQVAVQADFERVLRLAVANRGGDIRPAVQEVRVPRRAAGAPLVLSVIPCAGAADRAVLPEGAGAMVLAYDADRPRVLPGERLAWLYRLTAAELKVCEALYAAGSIDKAAAATGLTRHTIRSHLKSIYAKFGVASQGQLMQKLSHSAWLAEGRGAAVPQHPRPDA